MTKIERFIIADVLGTTPALDETGRDQGGSLSSLGLMFGSVATFGGRASLSIPRTFMVATAGPISN
jgi:hypothetical protein